MVDEKWDARFRTHEEIRSRGAIGNLNEGIEITTHGMRTRLIAWPGNGFQTESVHVLTLAPGEESARYEYDMSDEAMVCFKGQGEVYLRGEWVEIEPGDIAYFPERVPHVLRNPKKNSRDLVLVNQICPPQFDLYEPAGYYDRAHGKMKFDAIQKAKKEAPPGNLSISNELHYNDSNPAVRAWNLSVKEIRRDGALFNMYRGARFSGIDIPMVLLLWPGYGVSRCGFHYGCMPPGSEAARHTHPVSDECIVNWSGSGLSLLGDEYVATGPLDVVLAPCGVQHGGKIPADTKNTAFPGGFASPPQLDFVPPYSLLRRGQVSDAALRNARGKIT
jgi:gentisate 1,2-dioxygenase